MYYYELNVYGSADEEHQVIRWASPRKYTGKPVICGKLVTYLDYDLKTYTVPEGITALGEACFVNAMADNFDFEATKLELPASLEKIDNNAFNYASFKTIKLDENNKSFVLYNGGLYSADGKRLYYVLIPDPEKEPEHFVKEGTEVIDAGVLNNGAILHLPASVRRVAGEVYNLDYCKFYAPEGSYAARYAKENGVELVLLKES